MNNDLRWDTRISIREDSSYNYNVFHGDVWLASFKMFRDASEFAAKQTILNDDRSQPLTPHEQETKP